MRVQQHYDQQFYALQGHMVELQRYRATPGEKNFLEQIMTPIFLEEVLAIEIM